VYTLSSASTECPARCATSGAGSPAFSQSDTQRAAGRRAQTTAVQVPEAGSCVVPLS
jgi:hypothetical protein